MNKGINIFFVCIRSSNNKVQPNIMSEAEKDKCGGNMCVVWTESEKKKR